MIWAEKRCRVTTSDTRVKSDLSLKLLTSRKELIFIFFCKIRKLYSELV